MQLATGEIICSIEITGINGPSCGRDFAPFYRPLRGRCCRAVCCIQVWISPAGLFFSIYLIIYFLCIWLHKATSITSHKWLSLSRCWKSHWDYIPPPGEAAKGPLCLGTRFVPNATWQIYLFRICPLSTAAAAAAALCFHNIKKKGPQRRAYSKTLHILPCGTSVVEMCPCVISVL